MTQTPAGWYPSGNEERYWDGTDWTPQTRPFQQQTATPAPGYYAPQQPPKKSHTARNVLIALAVLFVVFVGGCFAVVGIAANEVDKAIDKEVASDKEPGGPDNPLEINEGEAFQVQGFEYAAGWSVRKDFAGDVDIQGLKVTNNRNDKDSALVEIKFWNDDEVLALADCTTEPIAVGTTTSLSCLSADNLPKSYNKITINDTF